MNVSGRQWRYKGASRSEMQLGSWRANVVDKISVTEWTYCQLRKENPHSLTIVNEPLRINDSGYLQHPKDC
ncbi:hypothetical protein FGO68_gene6563 [Halteria grandinella]|uniref:Uncharacterized protein n=1 Tax=Halteria grandinella TaxID=5974 RepID=A0A8J8NVR5_HALGN|nr:hypothetical protein FGO68_gene6563 [Halteria grandinella]